MDIVKKRTAKKIISLCMGVILFSGCLSKDHVPSGILQPDVMEPMLIDLQLARATTLSLRLPTDSAQLRWIEYKQSIFSKYKTDSSQFRQSFEFYAAHPYVFNKVAERMMVKLDEMEYKGQTKPVTP